MRGGGDGGSGGGGGGPARLISSSVDDEDNHHHDGHVSNGSLAVGSGTGHDSRHPGLHHHSHGLGSEGDGVWVRLALLIALSVHSVMEGLGVGAKETKAYSLLFAIGVHKVCITATKVCRTDVFFFFKFFFIVG